jgi:hypothetical protein
MLAPVLVEVELSVDPLHAALTIPFAPDAGQLDGYVLRHDVTQLELVHELSEKLPTTLAEQLDPAQQVHVQV